MTPNVGGFDRIGRGIVGIVALVAMALGWVEGAIALIVGVVGVVLLATAVFQFCPLYPLLGLNTCPMKK